MTALAYIQLHLLNNFFDCGKDSNVALRNASMCKGVKWFSNALRLWWFLCVLFSKPWIFVHSYLILICQSLLLPLPLPLLLLLILHCHLEQSKHQMYTLLNSCAIQITIILTNLISSRCSYHNRTFTTAHFQKKQTNCP